MRNLKTTRRALMLALAAALATTGPSPLAGQTAATEGYDPMRQITAQLVKANLLIVQDVTGSMAGDQYAFNASNGQNAHGRLYWESVNEAPVGQDQAAGRINFNAKRLSNNANLNIQSSFDVSGAASPGIYTYPYSGTTGPQYPSYRTSGTPTVYATSLPVLLYVKSGVSYQYRLAYRCKPTGTWKAGDLLPWSTTVKWYYNDNFDMSSCSTGWGQGLFFTNPSRIMNVKNALGNSVYIGSDYTPPDIPAAGQPLDRWNNVVWDTDWSTWVAQENTPVGPTIDYTEAYKTMGSAPATKSYRFRLRTDYKLTTPAARYDPTFSGATTAPVNQASQVNWISDPGTPFPAFYTAATATPYKDMNGADVRSPGLTSGGAAISAGNWSVGWPTDTSKYGTVTVRPPSDIIGKNASRVNFGLQVFSSDDNDGPYPYLFPIDTYDTGNVERLQGFFAAYDDPTGTDVYSRVPKQGWPIDTASTNYETTRIGLTVNGGTPTIKALEFAKSIIETTFNGGNLTDDDNTWNITADPKKSCMRTYGVILVTDGMSNSYNPHGSAWVNPSTNSGSNAGQRVYVDVSNQSESNCPGNWGEYAPSKADEIFQLKLDKGDKLPSKYRYIYPRTWAIGISPVVGPCELDMIAYMGRTDASSPSGDAGFSGYRPKDDTTGDPGNPYLPTDIWKETAPVPPATESTWTLELGSVNANPIDTNAGTYDGPTGDRVWALHATTQRPDVPWYPGTYTGTDSWTSNIVALSKPFWQAYRGTYRASNDPKAPWWDYLPNTDPPPTGHGHNAYFANNAQALSEAFAAIVNATATGDYATNAPVSGQSAMASEMVFLPSTSFPNWRGHLYGFDTNKKPTDDLYVRWEAGATLNATPSSQRKIFTWNPADNALVEVKAANLGAAPLKDVAGLTAQVIDFIRGNDGSGNPRAWRLGPMINSAPAIVAPPGSWIQNTVADHKPFQAANGDRDPLIWVGSNDGMMHAFRSKVDHENADPPEPGLVEQIAIIPPSLLWKQVTLYNNFVEDPKFPTGQPTDILEHIYGVANSFRFGDVYDKTAAVYKTIGIVTLGPGGNDIVAMDVTSIARPDVASYPASPISILWTKTTGASTTSKTLVDLKETWSIPAMAPVKSDTWRLVVGSGFNPGNTAATQKAGTGFLAPRTYVLDPVTGTEQETNTLSSLNSPVPFVGNQAFADAVLFDPKAKAYQDDNLARVGLQADLNGRIWFLWENSLGSGNFDKTQVGIDVSTDVSPSQSQPIYYNPAASGYGVPAAGCVAYAFGSGALYERSTKVTGSAVGTAPGFVPRLYIVTHNKGLWATGNPKVPAANILSKVISSVWTLKNENGTTSSITFGKRTQMTGPPFMLVPRSGKGTSTALFLLYDPDMGCNGFSYVATAEFQGDDGCVPGADTVFLAYPAGVGAASGFTIAGDKVLVSKSGIGEGSRASLYEPPNISASVGNTNTPKVKWWKELK